MIIILLLGQWNNQVLNGNLNANDYTWPETGMGNYNNDNDDDEIDSYGFPIIPREWDTTTTTNTNTNTTNIPQDISAFDNTDTYAMSETTLEVLKR